jgi:ferrochelatase
MTAAIARWRWIPELRMVNEYWQEDPYVAAVADSIAAHWREHGRKHLLFSFHSIPKRYFDAGDPYHCFCQATARLVAERLGLASGDWSIGFQSRFGREEWLKPYVDHLLDEYARSGPKQLTLVCPGFATDCLETLEEIDIRYRATFLAHGGEVFDRVPCLNASDAQVALFEQLVAKHTQGWPEFEVGDGATQRDDAAGRGGASQCDDAARRAESRERALALGARS